MDIFIGIAGGILLLAASALIIVLTIFLYKEIKNR